MPKEQNNKTKKNRLKMARRVRPDDVRVGDYVAVLSESYEWVSMFCGSEFGGTPVQRATLVPNRTAPPVRIVSACLPYVLVQDVRGKCHVVDMRRVHMARVSKRFGKAAFGAMGRGRKS